MALWDSTFQNSPVGTKSIGVVDDELRALKLRLRERFLKEFNFPLDDNDLQFVPLPGIGVPFISTSAPATRSDGSHFTSEDVGRIWLKHEYTSFTASTPIGEYYLASADGAGDNVWRKKPNNLPIGSVAIHYGTFQNPSAATPYDSGTRPGWFLANGLTLDSGFPCGAQTTPHYNNGRYLKSVDQDGSETSESGTPTTGGRETFTLTEMNIPVHAHGLDTAGLATASTESAGNHSHSIDGNQGIAGSDISWTGSGSAKSKSTSTNGAHTHTVTLGGSTELAGEADPDAVDIDPISTDVMLIVRMY